MENGATLYSGGRVLVLDGVTPPQEALVVRDGRVAGVGDAGDMTRLAGKGARCVSVRGATIMPGLIDTHPHLLHFGAFTYPIQLCSLPREAPPNVEHDRFDETFHVVIGETPTDVAYFWNRPLTLPQGNRSYLNQVWLPLAVATDAQLTTALSLWLQHAADPKGSHQGSIRFVSLSLSQEQFQGLLEQAHGKKVPARLHRQ